MTSAFPPPVLPPQHVATTRGPADRGRTDITQPVVTAPVIRRPDPVVAFRVVVAVLGASGIVLACQLAFGADGDTSETSVRRAGLTVATAYAAGHAVFAWWTHRYRLIIDDLRWPMYRRETVPGAWATGWALTVVVAATIFASFAVLDAHVAWYALFGGVTLVLRIAMLTTLGANMARVVLGARRRLGLWGTLIAATDLLVVGVLVTAFVSNDPPRTTLASLAGWAAFALVVVGVALLSYMKRVERWTLAWWLQRHEPHQTDEPVATASGLVGERRPADRSQPSTGTAFRPGRPPVAVALLVPGIVLRYVVVLTYWLAAAAALRVGLAVGLLGGDLTPASDPSSAVERLDRSIGPFILAIALMQVAQGAWSVVQARAARRATGNAPSALVMGALFVAGPAVLLYGLFAHPDHVAAFIALAVLVNLACWVASFGAFSRTIQDLGRSARALATWSVVVSLHWILGFVLGPLSSLDDDRWAATALVGMSIVDAAIVVLASIHAWHAMRGMELAVRDHVDVEWG